jgi:hypothetical protein
MRNLSCVRKSIKVFIKGMLSLDLVWNGSGTGLDLSGLSLDFAELVAPVMM